MLVLVGFGTVVVVVSALASRLGVLSPILLFAVGVVLFTATCVALVMHGLLPKVPLAACFALGAIVAPPDAVAATAVARRIGLPRRMVSILEGESLINDATALVIFRVAVAAAIGQTLSVLDIAENALRASVGGVLIGALGGLVLAKIHRKITNPLLDNSVSLLA